MATIETVIGAILGATLPPSFTAIQRKEWVVRILKRYDFEPEHPPREFSGVYTYALVEYGVGKDKALLELFKSEEIKTAFRESFEKGDLSSLLKEIDHFADWNIIGDQIRNLGIDVRQEIDIFAKQFFSVVDRSRTPLEVRSEQKLDEMLKKQEQMEAKLESIALQISPSMDEPSKGVEESFREELEFIKGLIDTNKLVSARERARKLEDGLKGLPNIEKEIVFLINAYLAQSYLNSAQDQEKAIPYLIKAAESSPDEERGFRNYAVAHLLKGEIKDGLKAIDRALDIEPNKVQSINIKMNLLIAEERYDDVRELLSEEKIKDQAQLCTLRAKLEFLSDKFEPAIEFAKKAIELDHGLIDSYLIKADSIREQIKDRINQIGVLDIVHNEKLKEAMGDLTIVIGFLDERENEKYAYAIAQRGVIHNLMHNPDDGRKDLDKAKELLPGNAPVIMNLSLSCWAMKDYDAALENLKLLDHGDPLVSYVTAEVYADKGLMSEAIETAEGFIKKQEDDSDDLRMQCIYIELLDRDFQTTKAEETLKEYENKYSGRSEITLARAKHLMCLGDYEGIISLLEPCYEASKGVVRNRMITILADAYFKKNRKSDYRRAAELYEMIADITTLNGNLMVLVASLYNSGQLAKCLEICVQIKKNHGFVDYLAQIEVYIYLSTENFQYASLVLEVLVHKHPDNIRYLLEYGNCMYRLGRREVSLDVLRQVERKVGTDANGMALISTAYASVGKFENALRFALLARQTEPENPSFHKNYFFIFLRAQNFMEKFDDEYIAAFREIADKFNEKFPGEPGIEKREMPRDPAEFKREFVALLEPYAHRGRELERIYSEKHLPVSFMAKASGRNIVSTWRAITSNPMLKVWFSSGVVDELSREKGHAKGAKSIIIDPISLLTLEYLGLFSEFIRRYEKILVCQCVIDSFQQLIDIEQISLKDGYRIFVAEDGKIFSVEVPPSEIKRNVDMCVNLIEKISDSGNIEIIGKSIARLDEESTDLEDNFELNFGEEMRDTIWEARERSLPLFAEDWLIRRFAESEHKTKCFGTQVFLNVLQEEKIISEGKFNELLIELIAMNYHFVFIYPETLYHAVMSEGLAFSSKSMIPFEALRHPDYIQPNVINLTIGFLRNIWMSDAQLWYRANWTSFILNIASCNRNKRIIIEQILGRKNEIIIGPRHPGILKEFDETIKDWIAAQNII